MAIGDIELHARVITKTEGLDIDNTDQFDGVDLNPTDYDSIQTFVIPRTTQPGDKVIYDVLVTARRLT